MLNNRAQAGLHGMLRFGCFLYILPFRWDSKANLFSPASNLGLAIFRNHVRLSVLVTTYAASQLIRYWSQGDFPLVPKLLTMLWLLAYFEGMVAILELNENKEQAMGLANTMLGYIHSKKSNANSGAGGRNEIDKMLTWTFYVGLFLLLTNPATHTLTVYKAPCAPPFISSSVFPCHTFGDQVPTWNLWPFIIFEYYSIALAFYAGSFHWALTLITLSWLTHECNKLGKNIAYGLKGQNTNTVYEYRKMQLVIGALNTTSRSALAAFSSIPFLIVALLLFGFIRLWRINPDIMFPICGFRCGFEAITPLILASNLSSACKQAQEQWRKASYAIIQTQQGRGIKQLRRVQRSCRRILCEAGSVFSFEHSIVLCCVNNCIQLTVNLLVSF